ncbi:GntR family transcriptional regulator [Shimia thalassica]|jgi:DNA-binding GntR family transcriptional regulator|uniref:Putative HTH-type transcriptional regulator YdfH n=1 Tax=Shimia thalassica TaxID=1715693 RepID=A0A0P1I8H0_9RHOB|nr:GntR family transcriptional regulator [Shimia thalassica]PHO02670.1 GntR family transcriptional regulator [Rhodobacteraceae bacterium 4F10]MDO6481318.1 GntR family transcriptional regulator [Shimia thalassica]MDO6485726.1 GntR family transcriptional regulator [Shimia thalassica]MDO6523153.1 GntR family transcriptional regulator [Shimia thalassica]MDO6800338.1 GntR family transcriptional regulator [Shimia thalassica]
MALTRPKSLKELALEHLRESIIDGTLAMGQTLSERGISEDLGVSKSPVREALAQLRDEGLVNIEPQKGVRVFTLSEEEVAQICDFRQAIESAAFELALERNPAGLAKDMKDNVAAMTVARKNGDTKQYLALDTAFHQLIFKHAGNAYLASSYERYLGKIAALRTHLSGLPKHTDLSYLEHGKLADAVRTKDMPEIRRLLAEHIDRTREAYSIAIDRGQSSAAE